MPRDVTTSCNHPCTLDSGTCCDLHFARPVQSPAESPAAFGSPLHLGKGALRSGQKGFLSEVVFVIFFRTWGRPLTSHSAGHRHPNLEDRRIRSNPEQSNSTYSGKAEVLSGCFCYCLNRRYTTAACRLENDSDPRPRLSFSGEDICCLASARYNVCVEFDLAITFQHYPQTD